MKVNFIILLFFVFGKLSAQTDSTQPSAVDSAVYYKTDIHAAYPGGDEAWKRYLAENIEYPDNEMRGEVVIQFLVSKAGKVDSTKVISGPPGMYKEAIRLVRK